MAGRFPGVITVKDEDVAVPGCDPDGRIRWRTRIVGDDPADQGTASAGGQTHGLLGVGIGDDRGHRAEGLDVVNGIDPGVIDLEHGGRDIGAAVFGGEAI